MVVLPRQDDAETVQKKDQRHVQDHPKQILMADVDAGVWDKFRDNSKCRMCVALGVWFILALLDCPGLTAARESSSQLK